MLNIVYMDIEGNYPRYSGDIQAVHPDWNVGDPLPDRWRAVEVDDSPETVVTYPEDASDENPKPPLTYQKLVREAPVFNATSGVWTQGWSVETLDWEAPDETG
jgi:hypothetical protein